MTFKLKKLAVVLVISIFLLLGLFTYLSLFQKAPSVLAAGAIPDVITTSVNIGAEPPTLDPGISSDTSSHQVIEQLFIGLVDIEDDTGAIKPELASDWQFSSDRTVFTFTLRNDIIWTDGQPVTAQDVEYSVLYSLDPATNASSASLLYPIKNAEEYHNGTIADPAQVGITAINATTLRFVFDNPLNYEAFFALPAVRPLPQWAIQTWGTAWTDPANIVTNGAYKLTEWNHDNYIILDKNQDYYDAASVQIDQVKMWMESDDVAGQMYLNGQLDTTNIWDGIPAEVLDSHAVKIYPRSCTYYYGMNINKAPFNNLKVRQAFAAAVNRQGLINSVLSGDEEPALTFSSPGVFGHVDGYADGIGIPYNPTQAQQWLAEAGYPNGQGLPQITLQVSDGHEEIAEYIRSNWYTNLGVNVTVKSLPWNDHLASIDNGEPQIWRLGWCADYPDAYNFLHEGIETNGNGYGNWSNTTYDALLAQALQTTDQPTQKNLYKQAEEILVETDAVMIPVYYYVGHIVSKPYLERTYGIAGDCEIANWRITRVYETLDSSGGQVSSEDGQTAVEFPANTFTDTVDVIFSPAYATGLETGIEDTGQAFELTAVYSETGTTVTTTPVSFTIAMTYNLEEMGGAALYQTALNDDNVGLFHWDGNDWVLEPATVDTDAKTITAVTNKLGLWAVLEEKSLVFLPLVTK